MDMQPVRLGSKTIFTQSVSKLGLGDRKKMYTKRGGPTPFFTRIPLNLDLWMGKMEKKCMKRKGNNVPISSNDAPKYGFGDGKM